MRYVAAYLLATIGGKESPNSADIEKILSSVGIEADGEKLKKVIGELNGKNIEELIAAEKLNAVFVSDYGAASQMLAIYRCRDKLATVPAGGGAAAPAAGGGAAAPAAAVTAAPEKEEKKAEKKEESESEDDDMGFGLFD